MISVWINKGWLTKQHVETIQQFIDSLMLPSYSGKISKTGFSSFKYICNCVQYFTECYSSLYRSSEYADGSCG